MFAVGCSWLQLVEVDKLDKVGLDKVGLDKGGCSFYTGYENRNQPGCGFLWLVAVNRLDKGGCGFYTGYENRNQVAVDKLDKGGLWFLYWV